MSKSSGLRRCGRCLAGCVVIPPVFIACLLAAESNPLGDCASTDDCQDEANGWTSTCFAKTCYVTKADSRCLGKAAFTEVAPGILCSEEKAVRRGVSKKTVLETMRLGVLTLLGHLKYWPAVKVLGTMWMYPADRPSQMYGCSMLSTLGWNDPESKEVMMGFGALELAIGAVHRFHGDYEAEFTCLDALAALSLFNKAVSIRVGQLGVVETTMDFWKRYAPHKPKLNIANFFGCYQDFWAENRERMREVGAIEMMLNISGWGGTQFDDKDSQFKTWCGFSSFHTEANHAEFRRLGGLKTTTIVFREHAKSYRVREEILQAMLGVCAYRINRQDLVKEGFFEQLIEAVRDEAHDPQVVALGLWVLRHFVDGNETLRSRLRDLGGIALATGALETHGAKLLNTRTGWDTQNVYGNLNDAQYNVPGAASEVLFSMALDSTGRRAMLEAGVPTILAEAIQATAQRIPEVRYRTKTASCQTLLLLQGEAEAMKHAGAAPVGLRQPGKVAAAVTAETEIPALLKQSSCPTHREHPQVKTHAEIFEP